MNTGDKNQAIAKKVKIYQQAFKKHKVSPKSLMWTSQKSITIRYQEILTDLNFEGKTILDVGCAFGNIIPFISEKAKKFKYTGIDIVPEFIQVARNKYPKHRFILQDYYGHPLKEMFDIVFTSGTLNANFGKPLSFRKKAIKTLFDHAKECLVFNMAGFHPQPKNNNKNIVYYADSLAILKYCFSLTSKIIFRHHYHQKDFTILMFK
jgi:SAM-dependent methyltransferase